MMRQSIFFLFLFLPFLFSCEKWELSHESFPEVITGKAEVQNSMLSARLFGEIKGLSKQARAENHGHIWSAQEEDILELPYPNRTNFGKTDNSVFQSEASGLAPGQTYYYRAYGEVGEEVFYGEIKTFSVGSLDIAMQIDSIVILEKTSTLIRIVKVALSYSNLLPSVSIQDAGIVMANEPAPNINDHFSESTGSFSSPGSTASFTLTPVIDINEDHYFRPYALVNGQIFYGPEVLFIVTDIWIRKADFPVEGRLGAVGFSSGSRIYIGLGETEPYEEKVDFWEYNPATDGWASIVDFPGGPRYGAAGFYIGKNGYVGMGFGASRENDLWAYGIDAGQWASKDSLADEGRVLPVSFSIGNKGYIGTGIGRYGLGVKDFWEYDPDLDQWSQKADFAGGIRDGAVGFSIGNKGYVGTGYDGWFQRKDFWEYDPVMDQWASRDSLPASPRDRAVGFSIGNKGYVGLGGQFGDNKNDFWEYDPATEQWAPKAGFPGGARIGPVGFSIGSKGYVGLGKMGSLQNDFWEYKP